MTNIADLAKYRASLLTPAAKAGETLPSTNAANNNESENTPSVRGGFGALVAFGKCIVAFLMDILQSSRRGSVLDELSPHIQRDIGYIDFTSSKGESTWRDPTGASHHLLRKP
jgi:hypothetical protein